MFRISLNTTGVFVFLLMLALLTITIPFYARAECRDVVWESAEYKDLISKGWGPIVMYVMAPPPGTKHQLCSGWKNSLPTTPTGTRPATAPDLPAMRAAGIPNPTVGMPWNPSDPNVGQAVGQAKEWLQQHATKSANISCMSPQFAEKLKKFMEAVPGGPPTITDGYRGPEKQNALVASGASRAGPCESYHNYGLAADFNNSSGQTIGWMRSNSRSFGINVIGTWDPNHFQDGAGKSGQCGACANDTGNGTLPDVPSNTPSSSLANAIRQALGMQPPPPPPPPQQSQPLPQNQQPFQSLPPTTPASTAAGIMDSLLNLQSATSATSTNIQNDTINMNTNTSANNTTNTSTSTFDLINQYANPTSDSIDIGGASPDLNQDTQRALAQLQGAQSSSGEPPPARRMIMVDRALSQQTFTSNDLGDTSVPAVAGGPRGRLAEILDNIKNTLLAILSYLKPFGGRVPSQTQSLE